MAPSPSPSAAGAQRPTQARRSSQSPPQAQQPLSKRDKRRTMIDQKLQDIATSFTSNRDMHLRTQLNALSRDMQYITRADLYSTRLLDDRPDKSNADPFNTNLPGSLDGGNWVPLGSLAARFVEDINNEMETRDAGLSDIDVCDRAFSLDKGLCTLIVVCTYHELTKLYGRSCIRSKSRI